MPDHPPSPRRPARRHPARRHPARRDDATGPHRRGPAAPRRAGADAAPAARRATLGNPSRVVPPALGTGSAAGAGGRVLDRATAAAPLTVWLLDPPASATVGRLRARLRLALADPATPDPATPDPARSTATGTAAALTASDATRRAIEGPEAPDPRRDLDDLAPDDRAESSYGLRHGIDTGQRPACRAVPGARVGVHATTTSRPDPVSETVTELVTNPQGVTVDPAGPCATIPGSARGVAPEAAPAAARCVLIDAGRDPLDASGLAEAAARLGPRDVLAVMTFSHHDGQRLHDPRPALVAAATAAGLEHRQHIVTLTRHHDTASGQRDPGREPGWELGPDLSMFTRRPTNHASNHAADRQQEAHR